MDRLQISLRCDTRTFKEMGAGSLLSRTGKYVEAKTTLDTLDLSVMAYDHSYKLAVAIDWDGEKYWMLLEELKLEPSQIQSLEELWAKKCAARGHPMSRHEAEFFALLQIDAGVPVN